MQVETGCRCCGSSQLETILSLGDMPLADAFAESASASQHQARFPLTVGFCPDCSLVQILETVSPEELFCKDYPYYSSFSDALLRHARRHCEQLIHDEGLGANSCVVEIASNDGYLLQNFAQVGIPVLGVDPASGPAAAAERRGVPTLPRFFTKELADQLCAGGRRANVIIANNVLAHVANVHDFLEGVKQLLAPEGVATFEFPYVRDMVDHCEFDTIYHEHLCYFSLHAVRRLLSRHRLHVHDVQRISIHGGSLRVYASHDRACTERVHPLLDEEQAIGLIDRAYYRNFADRVTTLRRDLRSLLKQLRGAGKRIAAYGAAAKGAMLLNYIGMDADWVEFVVDRNTHKQGRYMPGVPVEISDPARLLEDRPDYVLLLAWNFKDEIVGQQEAYLRQGGKFICPVPKPYVITNENRHPKPAAA